MKAFTEQICLFDLSVNLTVTFLKTFCVCPTAQSMYLCLVDLHKLQHLCGFDVVDRYRKVSTLFRDLYFPPLC